MKRLSWGMLPVLGIFLFLTGCSQDSTSPTDLGGSEEVLLAPDGEILEDDPTLQQEEFIGFFEFDEDPDDENTYCRYKVVGLTGEAEKCFFELGEIVCIPCKRKKDCHKEGTKVTAIIAEEQLIEGTLEWEVVEICRLTLESLSENCERCPDEGFPLSEFISIAVLGDMFVDDRTPERGEKFCRFRVVKIDEEDKEERKKCPVKKRKIVCIPCPKDKKCIPKGVKAEVFIGKDEQSEDGCIVILKSLSSSCTHCKRNEKILKETKIEEKDKDDN